MRFPPSCIQAIKAPAHSAPPSEWAGFLFQIPVDRPLALPVRMNLRESIDSIHSMADIGIYSKNTWHGVHTIIETGSTGKIKLEGVPAHELDTSGFYFA